MGAKRNRKRDVVEGFRVLTLLYSLDEIPSEQRERLKELFKKYRAIAAMYYWSKRLGLEEGVEQALKRAKEELPSYWRRTFNEGSPLYAFSEIEKMKRSRKQVLKLPLAEALHRNNGAYTDEKESKLRVRLGDGESLELPIPERALKWLKEKEREVAPLKVHKTVRIQWRPKRAQALKVQIVFKCKDRGLLSQTPKTRCYASWTSTPATVSPRSLRHTTTSALKSSRR